MNVKLEELENDLINSFPARLVKEPITFKQFKEYEEHNCIEFKLKARSGNIIIIRCFLLDDKKYLLKYTYRSKNEIVQEENKLKKIKDIIKFANNLVNNN